MSQTPDRLEKTTILHAPLERVWTAITDSRQFGAWFGVKFKGPFAAGQPLSGVTAPTQVDPRIAAMQEPYAGKPFEITVAEIVPMSLFSFRWHPYAIDPNVDYSQEPTTLIEFRLEPVEDGTRLTIIESGFDQIPLARRAKAFEMNSGGWTAQLTLVTKYLHADPNHP